VSNYLRVTGTASVSDATTPKTATAGCTGGRRALGGGYFVAGSDRANIAVVENYPLSDTVWTVTADESDGVGTSWSVQAYVICATAT
jgi:hypothetical protein